MKLTKKDNAHFIIYRFLDQIGVSEPYIYATQIVDELKEKKLLK